MTCAIKICGVTGCDDARMLSESGVDYLGVLVNVRQSPRSVSPEKAREIIATAKIPVMLLTYDHEIAEVLKLVRALRPAGVQLAGTEHERYLAELRNRVDGEVWKTLHLPGAGAGKDVAAETAARINRLSRIGIDRVILDTVVRKGSRRLRGGTGTCCDWQAAARIKRQVDLFLFLAGGINPENVQDALRQVRPDGIDLSSGVESAAGKKDAALVSRLVAAVRASEPQTP